MSIHVVDDETLLVSTVRVSVRHERHSYSLIGRQYRRKPTLALGFHPEMTRIQRKELIKRKFASRTIASRRRAFTLRSHAIKQEFHNHRRQAVLDSEKALYYPIPTKTYKTPLSKIPPRSSIIPHVPANIAVKPRYKNHVVPQGQQKRNDLLYRSLILQRILEEPFKERQKSMRRLIHEYHERKALHMQTHLGILMRVVFPGIRELVILCHDYYYNHDSYPPLF